MPGEHEQGSQRVAGAAERTVAALSGRVFAAWSDGSTVPNEADRRCEGVADFVARRAHVWQIPLGTARLAHEFVERQQGVGDPDLAALAEPQEMTYDGGDAYIRVAGKWTGFFLGDADGPRTVNDPMWPLDALHGAKDVIELGTDTIRGVSSVRYSLTVDLARADAALRAGITVPTGPYRALRQLPAEVWLDSEGRARRIAVQTEATAADDQVPVWSILELWDFGVTAEIRPPDRAEVVPPREAYRETPTASA